MEMGTCLHQGLLFRGFQGSGNGHGTGDTTAGEEMMGRMKISEGTPDLKEVQRGDK